MTEKIQRTSSRVASLVFIYILFCSIQVSGQVVNPKPVQSVSPKSTDAPLGIQLNYEKRTLPNGLVIILAEDHTVPLVSFQTWFKVGSVDEVPGITGMSHLFEHLMFKGTPKYGPKKFFQELEAKGSEINAYTTRDYTVYYETFASNLLEKVVDLESDRMTNLTLTDEILNNERMVVLEERRLRTDNVPEGKMQEVLWQLAYRYHPYQWPVIGYPRDVMSITLTQLMNYFKTYYQPANAALVLVGDFKTEEVFALLKKNYEKIPSVPRPKRVIVVEPPQGEERRLILRDQVSSERLVLAYHASAGDNDDSYALDIAANILFQGTSSRAYRRLVEEKEMMSAITGSAYTPSYPGLFIVAGTMKGKLSSSVVETELFKLISEFKETGVTEEEIRIAVKQLTVQLVDSIRTPFGLGQLIGTVQTIFGDPKRFVDDLAKYSKVKAADVQRVAQKYFDPNNRVVVTMVPK
ncbi:MAG: pitrilysin family protein [Bdellovibrionia bacterium]